MRVAVAVGAALVSRRVTAEIAQRARYAAAPWMSATIGAVAAVGLTAVVEGPRAWRSMLAAVVVGWGAAPLVDDAARLLLVAADHQQVQVIREAQR